MFRYIVVKTDQHIVERGKLLNGRDTNGSARRTAEQIAKEPLPIDAVIDLGDLADTALHGDRATATASADAYDNARQLLSPLPGPQLFVHGNHDNPDLFRQFFTRGWDQLSSGCGRFRVGPVTFVGLETRTGPEPTGLVRDEDLDTLEEILSLEQNVVLCTHAPWFPCDNPRVTLEFSVRNPRRLRALAERHVDTVRGVFHGHLHVWWNLTFRGIPVYGSTGSGMAFSVDPQRDEIEPVTSVPLGYLLVTVSDDGSLIVRPRFILDAE